MVRSSSYLINSTIALLVRAPLRGVMQGVREIIAEIRTIRTHEVKRRHDRFSCQKKKLCRPEGGRPSGPIVLPDLPNTVQY